MLARLGGHGQRALRLVVLGRRVAEGEQGARAPGDLRVGLDALLRLGACCLRISRAVDEIESGKIRSR